MTQDELLRLLAQARTVLERYLFDADEAMRDDVAEVCMAIEDVLPDANRVAVKKAELTRDPQRSAA